MENVGDKSDRGENMKEENETQTGENLEETEVKIVEEKAIEESKEELELRELKEELKAKEANLKNHKKRKDGGVFMIGPGQSMDVPAIDKELENLKDVIEMKAIEIAYDNPLRPTYSFEQNERWRAIKRKLETEGPKGLNAMRETLVKVEEQKERIEKEIPELEKEIPELKEKIEKLTMEEKDVVPEGREADQETESKSD